MQFSATFRLQLNPDVYLEKAEKIGENFFSNETSHWTVFSFVFVPWLMVGGDFTYSLLLLWSTMKMKLLSAFEIIRVHLDGYSMKHAESERWTREWKFIVCLIWTRMNFIWIVFISSSSSLSTTVAAWVVKIAIEIANHQKSTFANQTDQNKRLQCLMHDI